jgi:MFS family permease
MNKFKILGLLSVGSSFEFYDFTIYGLFASFMQSSFFPQTNNNSVSGFIGILLIFGVGYIARPLGGIIFGSLGDKFGRKYSFRISLLIMAVSTMLIGLIPSYTQIGIYAPILLLLLRFTQGISIGAELPISSVFVFEHLSMGKNIFYGATLFGLSNLGLLLGNVINFILTSTLTHEQTHSFGWRIPFLFGGVLCVFAFYLRKHLNETDVFKSMQLVKSPGRYLIKNYKLRFMASTFLALSYGVCVNFGFVLLFTILEQLYKTPEKILSGLTLITTFVFCGLDSIIGLIADKYKIKLFTLLTAGFIQFSLAF